MLDSEIVQDELIFKASIKKALGLLAISICFVAVGVWMSSDEPVIGWLIAGFFGLGIPASLLMMRPGSTHIRLHPEGFEVVAMSRRTSIKWSDVEAFQIGKMSGNKMIAIVYSPEYNRQRAGRAIASALAGIEGGIADHYTVPLDEICDALNEWRVRFGRPAA